MRKVLAGWLFLQGMVLGCPSGYESQAALAKAARLIIGVKVESVTDSPAPKGEERGVFERSDDEDFHNNAQAKVKVTEILRGTCQIREFTLLGGPYATCAPFASYVPFKPGDGLFLLLDRPLPEDTKTVVITWRCRVFFGTKEELLGLLDKAAGNWTRMVDLHRALFPEAMSRAEALLPASREAKAIPLPRGAPYADLACLRLLLCDPQHLRPAEVTEIKTGSIDAPVPGEDRSAQSQQAGIYRTNQRTTPWQSDDLDKALAARAAAHPKETTAFNRSLLLGCLTRHLGVPEARAGKIAGDDEVAACLRKVQVSPLSLDLDLRGDPKTSRLAKSASFLLAVADDENDRMVWRTFGMEMRDDAPTLDAGVFLPYLEQHPEQFTGSWGGTCLLFAMPDPRISPFVRKAMLETANLSRLDNFFAFFARLGDDEGCIETLERLGKLAAEASTGGGDEKQRQWVLELVGMVVADCREAADKAHCKHAPVIERLKTLAETYPTKQDPG